MSSCGGYPLGADEDSRAPWKEKPVKDIEVPVVVSITFHKYMNVTVPENYKDMDYNCLYDGAYEKLCKFLYELEKDGWIEDEIEVVEDI